MPISRTDAANRAREYLNGRRMDTDDAWKQAKQLKKEKQFGLARRLIRRIRQSRIEDDEFRIELMQQHAVCTYKDPDLLRSEALPEALRILGEIEDLKTTKRKETLGIAGAIHRRMWEVDGRKDHLEDALEFYRRGHQVADSDEMESDKGYTGINAAFLLDQLAYIEENPEYEEKPASVELRRNEARQIRKLVVKYLLKTAATKKDFLDKWWSRVTLAEAYFGLRLFGKAKEWLERAVELEDTPDWECESTVKQLARLTVLLGINLHKEEQPEEGEKEEEKKAREQREADRKGAREALGVLIGDKLDLDIVTIGKVGLALSGGGFRASLFHIGVLARLAELDVLRHLSVLSCVSGGSIIGAHYYLELKKKMEACPELTKEDYIEVVNTVARRFLTGVQRNLRTRVAANLWNNILMIFGKRSRTIRLAKLIEKEIYRSGEKYRSRERTPITDLRINPKDWDDEVEGDTFSPKKYNWRRTHKVPILVLNATTLNTGHNWQYTASWMGEPPDAIRSEVEPTERLRRMYYEDAPEEYREYKLGDAVAASACVPGLFEPVSLPDLYPERTVELVDGGVHDNQGTSSLLEQDCDILLVSDASGQMDTLPKPKDNVLAVPLRSNSILQARVRSTQYDDLDSRVKGGLLRGLMFIHLKKGLEDDPVDWEYCPDPYEICDDADAPFKRGPLTSYGVLKTVQRRIAAIRTDLDSFTDTEAFALMISGYRMCSESFQQGIGPLPEKAEEWDDWIFRDEALEEAMTSPTASDHRELLRLLGVSNQKAFKIWRLKKWWRWCALAVAVALAGAGVRALVKSDNLGTPLVPFSVLDLLYSIAILILGTIVGKTVIRLIKWRSTAWKVLVGLGLSLVGWAAAWIHVGIFDRRFLKAGRRPESKFRERQS